MSAAAFSLPQLRASLWAREGARVHAVIDGLVVPEIAQKLRAADAAGWDCLQRGALGADAAAAAPYLVELKAESPFTDWLLGEAPTVYPGWGVLMVSQLPMLRIREHCRGLGEVLMPGGERRRWRWYDPEVLLALLPTLLVGQLDEVFAAGEQIVVCAASGWTWLALENGLLATDARPLMRAAA